MFAMQFSLMFLGIKAGMTPGLASILIQVQIFFSMLFVALFLNEKPTIIQIIGAVISFIGIGVVALHFDNQTVSLPGFLFIIGAAAAWGLGNLVTKKMTKVNMIELVVWGSFVACFPLLILSFIFEGRDNIVYSMEHISWLGIISILYIVYASTWIGYGFWSHLITHYPVGSVVPFTLLVPIFAMLSSAVILDEPLYLWKITAGILVLAGLCINLFGSKFLMRNKTIYS
jgi:O-acetylserine/cysteine efflux transporter